MAILNKLRITKIPQHLPKNGTNLPKTENILRGLFYDLNFVS